MRRTPSQSVSVATMRARALGANGGGPPASCRAQVSD